MHQDNSTDDLFYPEPGNTPYDQAARDVVELGNEMAEKDQQADLGEIADGLLAGAVQYWLYTRQPCGDPMCEECDTVLNPERRLRELQRLIESFAQESDYFHSPNDFVVGQG